MNRRLAEGRRGPLLRVLAWCVALPLGVAGAQTIKLPDFREEARTATQCAECGTVRSIRELTTARSGSPAPSLTPAIGTPHQEVLVGAIFYHSFSDDAAGYAGGVGTPEMRSRMSLTSYEITLRMDDDSYRFIERRDGARFKPGDRVRIVQGSLQPL